MYKRTRDVTFLIGGIQIRLVSAGHAIDEILEVSQFRAAMHDSLFFLIAAHPDRIGICVFIARGEVSFGAVEYVSDRIMTACHWT